MARVRTMFQHLAHLNLSHPGFFSLSLCVCQVKNLRRFFYVKHELLSCLAAVYGLLELLQLATIAAAFF